MLCDNLFVYFMNVGNFVMLWLIIFYWIYVKDIFYILVNFFLNMKEVDKIELYIFYSDILFIDKSDIWWIFNNLEERKFIIFCFEVFVKNIDY